MLCQLEYFSPVILEPACGGGHISRVLNNFDYEVLSFDLFNNGYGTSGVDFLDKQNYMWVKDLEQCDIITNPPYSLSQEFVERALEIVNDGCKVAMFLKLQFLEGKKRRSLFEKYPPKKIWVSTSRLNCGKNGEFDGSSSAVCYAWFIWEKGYKGEPTIGWFN